MHAPVPSKFVDGFDQVPRRPGPAAAPCRATGPGFARTQAASAGSTLALAMTLTIALALIGGSPVSAQEPDDGLGTFVAYGCYQCHGYAGQGGAAGPRIAPSPYPYVAFAQLVRHPANVMPAYAPSVLDEADLRLIYDYVRSIPEPPAVDDIDILAGR